MTIKAAISDEAFEQLIPQIGELHKMALYLTLCHQVDVPGSPSATLATERDPKRLRLFDKDRPIRKHSPDDGSDVAVSSGDLDPALTNLIRDAFKNYNDLLLGRYHKDEHETWAGYSHGRALRKRLEQEVHHGSVPNSVMILLDVATEIATSNTEQDWQNLFEKRVEGHAPGGPPRPSA